MCQLFHTCPCGFVYFLSCPGVYSLWFHSGTITRCPTTTTRRSSSNHKRRATCGLIDAKCNRADDSRCVHTYRALFWSLAAYTYTYIQAYVEALLRVTVDGDCEDTKKWSARVLSTVGTILIHIVECTGVPPRHEDNIMEAARLTHNKSGIILKRSLEMLDYFCAWRHDGAGR